MTVRNFGGHWIFSHKIPRGSCSYLPVLYCFFKILPFQALAFSGKCFLFLSECRSLIFAFVSRGDCGGASAAFVRTFGYGFPNTAQIARAECPIIEPVSGTSNFSPDHSSVIGADISIGTALVYRQHDLIHIKISVRRKMTGFAENPVRTEMFKISYV